MSTTKRVCPVAAGGTGEAAEIRVALRVDIAQPAYQMNVEWPVIELADQRGYQACRRAASISVCVGAPALRR